MSKLSKEELDDLITSDADTRLGLDRSGIDASVSTLRAMMEACGEIVEASQEISSGGQFSVVASLPSVTTAVSSASAKVLSTLSELLKFSTGSDVYPSDVKDWSFIEDSLDGVFARIDEAVAADGGAVKKQRLELSATPAKDDRPQSAWSDLVDNHRPFFVPLIKEKRHAIEPLNPLILQAQQDLSAVPSGFEFGNVYEPEIRACLESVTESVSKTESLREIVEVGDLSSTECIFVDTLDSLDRMISAIQTAGEMAVDLEHHDIHSFRGFTSLIQISTRTTDYVLDPFPLFHSLSRLNIVTTDPQIQKTFHGADMDIQWLQRDFGVYVVNMFDTGQAARALGLAGGFGLANLLDTFCKVKANKRFQTSDWRQRPLSKDMLQYARTDTHYLLFIRDRLENLLLGLGSGTAGLVTAYGKKMLMQVMEKSFSVSLKIYRDSKCDYHPEAVRELCLKSPAMKVGHIRSNPRALAVLMAVLRWRDATARNLDESRNYVLPNGICLRLANAQPTTVSQVLRLSLPESSLYPSMRIGTEEADSLLELIKQAIADVDAVSSITAVVADTEVGEATGQASESRRSSVVLVGGEFGRLSRSTGRRDSVVSASGDVAFIPSSLFGVLTASTAVDVDAMRLAEVKKSVVQEFEACPALVKEDLDLFLAGSAVEDNAGIEEAAMEAAIAAVSFGTEFVSFKNQPSAPQMMRAKGDLDEEAADDEDIPLTVREQRKRNPEPVQAQPAAKKKKTASSAAAKALEFIEEELSLGSAKRKRK